MTTEITTADRCELLDVNNWDYNEVTGLWSKYNLTPLEVEEAYDIQVAFNLLDNVSHSYQYAQEMLNHT